MDIPRFSRMSFDVLIAFMLIFSFPSPHFYRSSVPAAFFLGMQLVFNSRVRAKFQSFLYTPYTRMVLGGMIAFTVYAYFWTKILGEGEFELSRVFTMKLIFAILHLVLYVYLSLKYGALGALKVLFYTFLLQSVIQIASFCSEDILRINRWISPISDNPDDLYGYLINRGFALSGVRYFGLSVPYSLLLVYYVYFFGERFKMGDILQVFIFILGAAFSARSFFLGIFAMLGVIFFLRRGAGLFLQIAAGCCCALVFSIVALPDRIGAKIEEQMFPWLFEWYYTFIETGELKTRSSEAVLKLHHFTLPAKTILIGDGRMIMPGGGYMPHLNTDAGYMRVLGFGGIFYLVISIIYQVVLISPLLRARTLNAKLLFCLVLVMLLLFQVKGDIFGSLTMMPCCLFIFALCVDDFNRQRTHSMHPPRFPLPPGFFPVRMPQ
jgi:hypothetical protein